MGYLFCLQIRGRKWRRHPSHVNVGEVDADIDLARGDVVDADVGAWIYRLASILCGWKGKTGRADKTRMTLEIGRTRTQDEPFSTATPDRTIPKAAWEDMV